jgi:hypothetical protein
MEPDTVAFERIRKTSRRVRRAPQYSPSQTGFSGPPSAHANTDEIFSGDQREISGHV